jgi:cysteine desulfurase/selenocysteine lyase
MNDVRADFPLLAIPPGERPVVYLDSAATTQKPRAVLDAMADYYARFCANVHRGNHRLAIEATAAYELARDKVARFVGAPDRAGVVFTKNCTEAINLVAYSWARRQLRPGDEILVTVLEHHSNLVPWQLAARERGAKLRHVPVSTSGELDLGALEQLVTRRTRLVCATAMSNVLGTAVALAPLVTAARSVGALVLVDAAQLVMHAAVDFARLGADFLAFSGHKMLGPTGIGVLVGRPELLEQLPPFLAGGEMVRGATLHDASWNELPHRFEAGTPPIAEAIGLGAAIDYLQALGPDFIEARDRELFLAGAAALASVEGLVCYGPRELARRAPIFAFNLKDERGGLLHPHDVETHLAEQGFAIRAGHHCAEPLVRALGVPATCRASCAFYNTADELVALAAALERARHFFLGT